MNLHRYLLVAALDLFFHLLPAPVAFWIGEQLGTLLSHVIAKRNRLILTWT